MSSSGEMSHRKLTISRSVSKSLSHIPTNIASNLYRDASKVEGGNHVGKRGGVSEHFVGMRGGLKGITYRIRHGAVHAPNFVIFYKMHKFKKRKID